MPSKIQPGESANWRIKGRWYGRYLVHYVQNADGNLNVPYAIENDDKVVVNWNWLDNDWNANNPALRFATLFISPLAQNFFGSGEFCLTNCPFQPPIILPIGVTFSEMAMYCLSLREPDSQRTISIILIVSTLRMAIRT